jgi:nucleotide-binding universal stress UspA family protein
MAATPYRHILVSTDFGDAARAATEHALALAQKLGAKVTLLHTWELPPFDYGEAVQWPVAELERQAQRALDAAVAAARRVHPDVEGLVVFGDPHAKILEVVAERRCDLIVMGTHGRKGMARLFLGSVAERVVRFAKVPVLTVSVGNE